MGMYSSVYKCLSILDGQTYACKVYNRAKLDESAWKNIINEITVLGNLESQNVIKIIDKFKSKKYFYIVLEYCNGGTLEQYISSQGILLEDEASYIFS